MESEGNMLEMTTVRMKIPRDANIIVGQAHFIKTVEDLYEAVATTVPQAKFGLAFNESSGACLTRSDGNDQALQLAAVENAQKLGCWSHLRNVASGRVPHQCVGRDSQCA